MSERRVRVRVWGRVQGVWFRAWTRQEAQALGLRGWVRNEPDGAVAAVIAGPEAAVAAMLAALRRGPEQARVAGVDVAETAEDPPPGFHVLR